MYGNTKIKLIRNASLVAIIFGCFLFMFIFRAVESKSVDTDTLANSAGGSITFIFIPFALWIIGALGFVIYHVINLLADKATLINEIGLNNSRFSKTQSIKTNLLNELEQLFFQEIITENEYEEKRKEILNEP